MLDSIRMRIQFNLHNLISVCIVRWQSNNGRADRAGGWWGVARGQHCQVDKATISTRGRDRDRDREKRAQVNKEIWADLAVSGPRKLWREQEKERERGRNTGAFAAHRQLQIIRNNRHIFKQLDIRLKL